MSRTQALRPFFCQNRYTLHLVASNRRKKGGKAYAHIHEFRNHIVRFFFFLKKKATDRHLHTNGSMYVLLTRDPAASAACTRSHSQIRVRPESSEPPEKNVRGGTTSTTRLILSSFHHSLHPFSTLSLSPIFPSYFVSSVTVGSKPKPQDQLRLKSRQGTNIEEEQLRQAPSPSISLPGLRPVFSTKAILLQELLDELK